MSDQEPDRMRYSEQSVLDLSDADGKLVLTKSGIPREHLLFGASETLRREVTADGHLWWQVGEVGDGDALFVDGGSGEV